jgi:hypothetical protein
MLSMTEVMPFSKFRLVRRPAELLMGKRDVAESVFLVDRRRVRGCARCVAAGAAGLRECEWALSAQGNGEWSTTSSGR